MRYTPENLKKLIRESGLTRREFAEKIGAHPRALANWCLPFESRGHRDMPAEMWARDIPHGAGMP